MIGNYFMKELCLFVSMTWIGGELEPVLNQFVAAASGKEFWISIYKLD